LDFIFVHNSLLKTLFDIDGKNLSISKY